MACTMPETRIYTLYMPVEKEAINTKTNASVVINMDSERYLKQPYIAHRNSLYRLNISKYSKWESSPNRIVKKEFKHALLSNGLFKGVRTDGAIPDGFYLLNVYLKSFERLDVENSAIGKLELEVSLISPDGTDLYHSTISKDSKLDNQDFTNLAKGLSSVWSINLDIS